MNRILIIEDELTLSLLLHERLEREGYSVTACKDGEQGLAQALREAYDLLLLDIQLPGRNGFEVCRQLRRHGMNVPVLMLTARGHVNDRVKGLKTGADDYLIKPFEVAELLARMEALLRRANNSPPQLIDSLFCFGSVIVDLRKEEVLRDGSHVELTAREFELLRYFVSHPDERISRRTSQTGVGLSRASEYANGGRPRRPVEAEIGSESEIAPSHSYGPSVGLQVHPVSLVLLAIRPRCLEKKPGLAAAEILVNDL